MDETEYRKTLQQTLDAIEAKFDAVDPDVAECEQAFGALTIRLGDGSRCILSAQPSVRQLWLALASQGTAYHFNYDASRGAWLDDKGKGLELRAFLAKFLHESTGLDLSF